MFLYYFISDIRLYIYYIITILTFAYGVFNVFDLYLNYSSHKKIYNTIDTSVWEYCTLINKPYRLKELIIDKNHIILCFFIYVTNPFRIVVIFISSIIYTTIRIIKIFISAFLLVLLLSLLISSYITNHKISFGVFNCINDIPDIKTLLYVILVERSYVDVFILVYTHINSFRYPKTNLISILEKFLFRQ
jgi:hypothetical protein